MKPSARHIEKFRRKVYQYYFEHGRKLPWRTTHNPYRIIVSEVMLQQTQITRVLPKYTQFLKRFSGIRELADAPLSWVLEEWQGLGYNRRARFLHQAARYIRNHYDAKVPRSIELLEALPGIGAYTARAIAVFAFEDPHPLVETNIRTAILEEFLPGVKDVSEREVWHLAALSLDSKNVREWFYALMDYGSFLKSQTRGVNQRSAVYRKQSPFRGSLRETRGAIVRALATQGPLSSASVRATLRSPQRFDEAVERLLRDGLLVRKGRQLMLAL